MEKFGSMLWLPLGYSGLNNHASQTINLLPYPDELTDSSLHVNRIHISLNFRVILLALTVYVEQIEIAVEW